MSQTASQQESLSSYALYNNIYQYETYHKISHFVYNVHISYFFSILYSNLIFPQYHFWICYHSWSSWFFLPVTATCWNAKGPAHDQKGNVFPASNLLIWHHVCQIFKCKILGFFAFLFGMVDNILSTLWKKLCSSNSYPSS